MATPIHENHSFFPGLTDSVFLLWKRKGIYNIGDLYINGVFASYPQLVAKYDIPRSDPFRLFQIGNYIRTHLPNFEILVEHEALESINKSNPAVKWALSFFYQILHNNTSLNTASLRQAWTDELNAELGDEVG